MGMLIATAATRQPAGGAAVIKQPLSPNQPQQQMHLDGSLQSHRQELQRSAARQSWHRDWEAGRLRNL